MQTQRVARRLLKTALALAARSGNAPLSKNDRGEVIDAISASFVAMAARSGAPHHKSVGAARAEFEAWEPRLDVTPTRMARTDDLWIEGSHGRFAARLYTPTTGAAPRPLLVYFHGGGFVLGSIESHDHVLRHLAHATGTAVLSVDYHLAPEHPFPAAFDDALLATRYAFDHAKSFGADIARIAVGGDSAGGNLAAAVSLALKGAPAARPLRAQLLVYPAVDLTRSFPSIHRLGTGYFLTSELMNWFMDRYLPKTQDPRDPRASPYFAASHAGLPAAIVVTAGFDPLRDEGEAYAEKLRAAGVPVVHQYEPAMIHGFLSLGGVVPAARVAIDRIAEHLAGALR